ncbi:MAG: alpha/beta hydrolase [Methanothrix sp.]|uniref:alpha/beta hydrolase n=1 Tax=Methanothrix sp. TaxID=90426 RepID=UPI003BB766B5
MASYKAGTGLLIAALAIALFIGWMGLPGSIPATKINSLDWRVEDDGRLDYLISKPEFNLSEEKVDGNSSLITVRYTSRGAEMAGLLRIPRFSKTVSDEENKKDGIPGIVLLPGATVTKEREQGLAKRLADLGYATITLDQRNLGAIDVNADLELFMEGSEPVEHMMVSDALSAAEILRSQLRIDPERIIYAGESNGARTAIIACALDERSKGVLAISTCGYGTDAAVAQSGIKDEDTIRFFRSIDPETYLPLISPRPLAMIQSENDTVIPYPLAERTFTLASQPKSLVSVGCRVHGYCQEMDEGIEKGLKGMFSYVSVSWFTRE